MSTKKIKKQNGKYIIFEKYSKNILGVNINAYILKFNKTIECKKNITIKLRPIIRNFINKNVGVSNFFSNKDKVLSIKLNKYDKNFTEKLIQHIDNYNTEKFTFCLNLKNIVFQETQTSENNSTIKNILSKHMILCDEKACASGEMIIKNDILIFDNNSGTYEPNMNNLQSLKKAIPFINFKITNRTSKTHKKYFGKL